MLPNQALRRRPRHTLRVPSTRRFALDQFDAFARVISDFATFANLVDLFVAPEFRGKRYSKALMKAVLEHPELQGLRRFTLATTDAPGLYAQFGFTPLVKPHAFMERYAPNVYASGI
jgi:GNAT superfamily N-acetyltransferase